MAEERDERPAKPVEDVTRRRIYVSRTDTNRNHFQVCGVQAEKGKTYEDRDDAQKLAQKYRQQARDGKLTYGRHGYVADGADEGGPEEAEARQKMLDEAIELVSDYYVGKGMDEPDAVNAATEKVAEFLTTSNRTYKKSKTLADRVVEMIEAPAPDPEPKTEDPPRAGDETSR